MRIYVGFDDTDTIDAKWGTGKLARWFKDKLPEGADIWGVVRQQLPVMEGIPYTSHNSSACVVVDVNDYGLKSELIERATTHISEYFIEGSDPGLCIVTDECSSIPDLVEFGRLCCHRIVSQKEAIRAAQKAHLSGHGGTNDGIIGAAAGVGLTIYGWSGRFIEFGSLRDFPNTGTVKEIEQRGIKVIPLDRDAMVIEPEEIVETYGWLRPSLWAHRAVLPVESVKEKRWRILGRKIKEKNANKKLNLFCYNIQRLLSFSNK